MAVSLHATHRRRHQRINLGSAIAAGVVATIAATIVLIIAQVSHLMDMNLPTIYGAMISSPSQNPYYTGVVIDLVIGGLVGIVYAAVYMWTNIAPNWLNGLGFGFIHWLIAGFLFGLAPGVPAWSISAPGMFVVNYGTVAIIGYLILHLVYGTVVGAAYRPKADTLVALK
jgi:hypothetical protein